MPPTLWMRDAGLSPSDDDRMVAGFIESYARRKASERATLHRIIAPRGQATR